MRTLMVSLLALCCLSSLQAHHPDRESQPVHPRYDLIGPLGNRLPMSYRRRYNRPTNLGGRIAYHIAPTSQEAMRWHTATHQGQYACDAPRMVAQYFYPKPWESIRIGARPQSTAADHDDNLQSMSDESAETVADGTSDSGQMEYDSDFKVEHLDLDDQE